MYSSATSSQVGLPRAITLPAVGSEIEMTLALRKHLKTGDSLFPAFGRSLEGDGPQWIERAASRRQINAHTASMRSNVAAIDVRERIRQFWLLREVNCREDLCLTDSVDQQMT
jgi:hypothetical protein